MSAFRGILGSLMHIVIDHAIVVNKYCRQEASHTEGTLIVQKITYISGFLSATSLALGSFTC